MIVLDETTVCLPAAAPQGKTILDRVSLHIKDGEWIALVGANGSGKTTTLHTIAGLIEPRAGTVSSWNTSAAAPRGGAEETGGRPRMALVLQEPDNQFVTGTVRGELELSLPPRPRDGGDQNGSIAAAAERFGLRSFLGRNPHCLSGGEKQRLVLASVWLQEPDVLLLDEPTSYLDREAAETCFEFVEELHRRGVTVVWATPGGEELTRAGRIVCLEGGRIGFAGGLDDFFAWADRSKFEYIPPAKKSLTSLLIGGGYGREIRGGGVESTRTRARQSVGSELARALSSLVPADTVAEKGRGRETRAGEETATGAPGGVPVLECLSASFRYGRTDVIRDLDLTVREGECVGITGPNGAGKSTLLDLAGALRNPSSGTLRRKYSRAVAGGTQKIFYLFQSPEKLFFAETVREEITFGLESLGVPKDSHERLVSGALDQAGLKPADFISRSPFSLSLGEMRRVALAIAAALGPELLLLDEPTSCLDPDGRDAVKRLIACRGESGRTTMVASHDTDFLAGVCDRIIWLRGGRKAAELITRGEELEDGAAWPEEPQLLILSLQDELAALGHDVTPRALTPGKLKERLGV